MCWILCPLHLLWMGVGPLSSTPPTSISTLCSLFMAVKKNPDTWSSSFKCLSGYLLK